MIIIMQRTLEYVIGLTKTPNLNPKQIEYINILWDGVNPDNMRLTKNKVKYVKIENI
jgi:hypothetical protein